MREKFNPQFLIWFSYLLIVWYDHFPTNKVLHRIKYNYLRKMKELFPGLIFKEPPTILRLVIFPLPLSGYYFVWQTNVQRIHFPEIINWKKLIFSVHFLYNQGKLKDWNVKCEFEIRKNSKTAEKIRRTE